MADRQRNSNGTKISVLLVDDSPVVLSILKRMLLTAPDIEVVGTARNGVEALELIPKLEPAVVCTDLHMPKMDGLELTREIMAQFPKPILVISVSVSREEDAQTVFRLLEAGAIDVFLKPRGGSEAEYHQLTNGLISKIRILSGVYVFRKRGAATAAPVPQAPVATPAKIEVPQFFRIRVVAIGASTGGPIAIQQIVTHFRAGFPVPIICVQHISQGFLQGLVEWLDGQCSLRVKIAESGEKPKPGYIYFPAEDRHLEVDANGCFIFKSQTTYQTNHCPSVNVTFDSIARYYGRSAVGVLLTGMGNDGATGLLNISQAKGITIAQDEKSSIVFGMPKSAIDINAAQHVISLNEIAPTLQKIVSNSI